MTRWSQKEMDAVAELLSAAEQYGLGVVFEPDESGWRINYVIHDWPAWQDIEMRGGELASAYNLRIAVEAALRPLIELGERADAYFGSRRQEKRD